MFVRKDARTFTLKKSGLQDAIPICVFLCHLSSYLFLIKPYASGGGNRSDPVPFLTHDTVPLQWMELQAEDAGLEFAIEKMPILNWATEFQKRTPSRIVTRLVVVVCGMRVS